MYLYYILDVIVFVDPVYGCLFCYYMQVLERHTAFAASLKEAL